MMQENRIWILMSRRLAGEATPAETEELHRMIASSPEKQYLLDLLHNYFEGSHAGMMDTDMEVRDLDNRFAGVLDRAEPVVITMTRNNFRRRIAWSAAAVVVMLMLGWGLMRGGHKEAPVVRTAAVKGGEVLAAAGARTRMVLPDGTTVWLNSNSKLQYRQDYNKHSREVELEGEGYFDVIKDVQKPFIVHTSGIDVKVLGTSFAVKCYAQDETIETTLLKGSIEVSRKDKENSPRVILKPNEKLVYNRHVVGDTIQQTNRKTISASPDIAVNSIPKDLPDSEKVETAWMYNRLVFNGDGFKDVAEKMERWYNVKITFKDERLYRSRFGGAFANESIEDALKALQLTTAFSYAIHGNEIEISSK